MRFAAKLMMAVALTACVATTADAQGQRQRGTQPPGGGRGMGGGGNAFGLVATNKVLQEELKVTDEQKTKLTDAIKPIQEKQREAGMGFDFRNASAEERKEFTEKMAKFTEETKKAVAGVLDEKQNKRLGQINYQMMGFRMFSDKDAVAALKVTDEQKEKVKGIVDEFQKDSRELMQGVFGGGQPDPEKLAELRKKTTALTKEAEEKVMALMTDDQKKMHKDMLGEKFDTSKLMPMGGGRPKKDD